MSLLQPPILVQSTKMPIMAHLVLGYPSLAESLRSAIQYMEAGVEILELQIPFSHPTADGPVITKACQEAVAQGVTVQNCLDSIHDLRSRFPKQEIMVMSYLNRIYTYGMEAFMNQMASSGVNHVIIPDLPVDALSGLMAHPSAVKLVPVLAANTSDERLEKLLCQNFDFFYLMSDFKITGSGFSLHPRLKEIIQKIRSYTNPSSHQSPNHPINQSTNHPVTQSTIQPVTQSPRIGIGFGISTPAQASLVAREADVAIIGSALIQAQNTGKLSEYLESLQQVFQTE